jgi:hypothetical protein
MTNIIQKEREFIKGEIWYLMTQDSYYNLEFYPVEIIGENKNDSDIRVQGIDGIIHVCPLSLFRDITLKTNRYK